MGRLVPISAVGVDVSSGSEYVRRQAETEMVMANSVTASTNTMLATEATAGVVYVHAMRQVMVLRTSIMHRPEAALLNRFTKTTRM